MDDLIAESLGKYGILGEIGRGGMGVVYKALDTEKNTYVAIKTIPPELAHHPEFLRRFQQEARALMRLHHPHIVGLIDLFQDQGSHHMVLEYVDGPSLSQLLTKGALPPERAQEITLQICGALSHAHQHNIVHRDIKPGNILLTKDGQVKVTDFGIARVLDATLGTVTGQVFGTVRYASPEQVKGLKVDERSDLYSLGVVLYEMVTGRPLFAGEDVEVMEQHLKARPVPPRELKEDTPQGLEEIILRCLEKDRESRYQSAEKLAADLRAGVVSERAQIRKEAVEEDRDRWKPIAVLGLIALVSLVGLAVFGVTLWPRLRSTAETTTPNADVELSQVSSPTRVEPLVTGTMTPGIAATEAGAPTTPPSALVAIPTPFIGQIAFLSGRDHAAPDPDMPWRRAELYIMNPDGSDRRRLTFGEEPFFDSGVPPRRVFWLDERRVVVDEHGVGDRALIFDTVAEVVERTIQFNNTLVDTDVIGWLMDWSPDGTTLAFNVMRQTEPYEDVQCAICTSMDNSSSWTRVTDWREDCDYGPVWSPDAAWLAFARLNPFAERGLYLMRPDGTGLRLLAGGLGFGDTRAWSPDGSMIASDAWVDSVFDILLVDVETGSERNLTNTADREEWHPSWSPDGTQIAFEVGLDIDGEIWVMNANGSGAHKIADGCCPAWQPAPETAAPEAADTVGSHTPTGFPGTVAGGRIAFDSQRDGEFNSEIYVMNADGSGQTNLTNNSAGDYYPSWSPDGTRIVFMSGRDGSFEIYVMKSDGTEPSGLTKNPATDTSPAWSPDGTRIAFESDRDGNDEIYVMNMDGSGVTCLTYNAVHDGWPTWSPDSTRIAFVRGSQVYVMNADGSDAHSLIEGQSPSWSPDGNRIAFESKRDGNAEIYVMKADGTGLTRLTHNSADDWYPSWSPDGGHIVFQSNRDGDFEVYRMTDDGTDVVRLTRNPGDDGHPSWSPR